MSDTSVTVKDLANDLHVQPRELLRVLHNLNISAKTLMSDVSVDNVPRVREYLASTNGEWQESRSRSDVVVRRRRRSSSEDTEKDSAKISKTVEEAPQEQELKEQKQNSVQNVVKEATKAVVKQENISASVKSPSEKAKDEASASRMIAPAAAKSSEQVSSEQKKSKNIDESKSIQNKTEQKQSEKNRSEQTKSKQNKSGQNRQEQTRSGQTKNDRSKAGQQPEQGRSDQTKLERNKSGQTRSEQGKSGQTKSSDNSRNAERANGANGNKPEDVSKKRKSSHKKSDRPIITVAAKVISRPTDKVDTPAAVPQPVEVPSTPVESQEVQSIKKSEKSVSSAPVQLLAEQPAVEQIASDVAEQNVRTEKKSIEGKDSAVSKATKRSASSHVAPKVILRPNDNRVRPDASATPDSESSAPSLLPPVESKNRDSEAQSSGERRSRRSESSSTPQVRIISRPNIVAESSRRNESSSRDGSKQGRDGSRVDSSNNSRDGRNNNDKRDRRNNRDNRDGVRSEGRDNRDGRDRDSRDRDGRNTNREGRNSRPSSRSSGSSRSGGMRSDMGMPLEGILDGRDGQSKKKRNKNQNRRGNDFMQMDDETMNFGGRRHEMDDDTDMPRIRGKKRPQKNRDSHSNQPSTQPIKAAKRKIKIEEGIRVADLAHQMGIKSGEIIKVLFGLGIMATINQTLDLDTASVVASEFGYEVEKTGFVETDYLVEAEADTPESLKRRPPVVTIMGHVDHGKTSLLDAIRKTHVTSGEAGGITQHIGAYYVKTKNGDIAFLDTPGHEAFTAMRARGAQITDLVVLVVAADDGVMEQTREAINHSRAAGVPIMVAVNKIDKPTANPERVLRELAEMGLVAEDWGGDTIVAKVSAKTHEGLDEMLELLALQAEILDLKANPDKPARGHIVEAKLDKGRGPVATVLIQEGTLHQGDNFVCGVFSGRVRAMFNDQGRKVKEAGPSHPVEVQGFEGVPEAGEPFICLTDEKVARRIAESRAIKQREHDLVKQNKVTLETFLAQPADAEEARLLNLVVKADVQGSLEAITEALNKQSTEKVKINIIHGGTGAITESDILLASASQAIVIGFNVRPTAKIKAFAEQENIDIRFYDIIYKLVDEIKSAMAGLLAPVSKEVYLGQAEVRQVYSIPKVGNIAGCFVSDGKLTRSAGIRLLRDGVVVHTGKLASLKRFKDDAREVFKGFECGVNIENFNDVKVGDILDAFEIVTEAAQL